jgi:hypothetical protein
MFSTLEEAKELCDKSQGVLTTNMGAVRDAYGAGRLGVHVRKAISDRLKSLGVGHYPEPLPEDQWKCVRLYRLGTPVADLIDAVLQPSAQHDEELRAAAGGEDAKVLRDIRALVCK